ncbi:unnamed protein product [Porites lobata]|uniref:Sulfatase N-terminal domain-containing protein n=1 Tax=Porites lobata TaxID=104759 RepID=A0ABN8RUY9_9CNID|nr:unnamed protein product [Porites lobata]
MRSNHFLILALLFSSFSLFVLKVDGDPPHILLINRSFSLVLDDLGWSDVGFHASTINTPNMDKLASEGVIVALAKSIYYVQPICSPTSALLSGMYPIHTGLQSGVIRSTEPYGLALDITILPQKLKEATTLFYTRPPMYCHTWAIGMCRCEGYGFQAVYSRIGYIHQNIWIYIQILASPAPNTVKWMSISSAFYLQQAQKVILSHNASTPLFLCLPFQSVHSPLQVPTEYTEKYENIKDDDRKIYAGMVENVDEAIGNITEAMKTAGLWDNTLLIVTTDNGGASDEGGYNWPLRGEKGSLWEGGVRGVGFVHGKMLQRTGVTCKELFHVTDWYPILHLAGIEEDSDSSALDGFNIWRAISEGVPSERTEILHNIDGNSAAIRVGDMKLLLNVKNQEWYEPPELSSGARKAKKKSGRKIRAALYNITADPNESQDLRRTYPDVVRTLRRRIRYYRRGEVPSGKQSSDPEARKLARKNGYWGPWIN